MLGEGAGRLCRKKKGGTMDAVEAIVSFNAFEMHRLTHRETISDTR